MILKNSVFGERMENVAIRLRALVGTINFKWGTPVNVIDIKEKLENQSYKIVAVVRAETSTSIRNPVKKKFWIF